MCTAINLEGKYFGRTLDYERSFGERILITPRDNILLGEAKNRYAMVGVGVLDGGVPLYFDGMNEWGLAAAALNFEGCAVYHRTEGAKAEISSGALVSFLLSFCRNTDEVKGAMANLCISNEGSAPLHWMVADRRGTVVIESVADGLRVYDNPVGVLTNSPGLDFHLTRLSEYSHLRAETGENTLTKTALRAYSRGMGAMGLPGDFSSSSRFVRGVFLKEKTQISDGRAVGNVGAEYAEIIRFFHIADGVSVPRGCVLTDEGRAVSTLYTSLCDLANLTYCFTTYDNREIRGIKLTDKEMQSKRIIEFPLYSEGKIEILN